MTFQISDNKGKACKFTQTDDRLLISKDIIPKDIEYIDIKSDCFNACCGDDGYYVIADVNHLGSHLCRFTKKDNYEIVIKQDLMPIFGVKINDNCIIGIAETMKQNLYIVAGVKDCKYYLTLRFIITGFGVNEDISVKFINLGKYGDFCKMAKVYREYSLEHNNCVPLKERIKNNKYLKYAMEAPEIRIRLGWKPAPPEIMEQTEENEPKMHVACTFDRVKDIINELKRQGVDKAQLCLVGWNKSGHDGRYPQLFPVEESLGGEQKLRELISYAQKNGYQIVCHTNSTDCYSIADTFSDDIVIKTENQQKSVNDTHWSGGRMYHLCPQKALEYAKNDIPKVADLGFKGIHYIDVMTVVPLKECYDTNHPCSKLDSLFYYKQIMELCHKEIGGFASEGAFDFAASYLDYSLYVSWADLNNKFFDEEIPLWELVYHGIILYNPSTTTVNCSIKGEKSKRKLFAYGGRPSFYFYSKFLNGSDIDDWLGREDLICDTHEQLEYSISKIKEVYDCYKEYIRLQLEYMVSFTQNEDGTYKTVYSDGTEVIL